MHIPHTILPPNTIVFLCKLQYVHNKWTKNGRLVESRLSFVRSHVLQLHVFFYSFEQELENMINWTIFIFIQKWNSETQQNIAITHHIVRQHF